jgi:hypothetical protein
VSGSGPGAPFLATAPLSVHSGRRRRRWLIPVATVVAVAAVVVLVALLEDSVARNAPEHLTFVNAGSTSYEGQTVSFPHAGTFSFTWVVTQGGSVTLRVLDPSGMVMYSANAARGNASLAVGAGGPYTVEILDWLSATVEFSGTLHYASPLL